MSHVAELPMSSTETNYEGKGPPREAKSGAPLPG